MTNNGYSNGNVTNSQRNPHTGLWIGVGFGVGGAIGGVVGYWLSAKHERKKAMEFADQEVRRTHKRIKREYYDQGTLDGTNETLAWMDRNVISVIQKQDNAEEIMTEIQKRANLEAHGYRPDLSGENGRSEEKTDDVYAEKETISDEKTVEISVSDGKDAPVTPVTPVQEQKELGADESAGQVTEQTTRQATGQANSKGLAIDPKQAENTENDVKNPDSKGLKGTVEVKNGTSITNLGSESDSLREESRVSGWQNLANDRFVEFTFNGTSLYYPKNIFYDEKGQPRGEIEARQRLKEFEKDIQKLKVVWMALGWGIYTPTTEEMLQNAAELQGHIPGDIDGDADLAEIINNWNLDIDGSSDAHVKSVERSRYLDEVDRYMAHPEEGPRIISEREFEEENYLDKMTVDYYARDNVFVGNEDFDKAIEDPYTLFGTSDGSELFRKKAELDSQYDGDPDWNPNPDVVYIKNFKMNLVAEITRIPRAYEELKDGRIYFENGGTD